MRQLAGIAKERRSESEYNERANSSSAVGTEHANKNQISGICKRRDKVQRNRVDIDIYL